MNWGVEVIIARLKALDLWRNDKLAEELILGYEKDEQIKQKDFRNNVESFLKDFRRQFAKATDGINTACLSQTDKRRLGEKKYGYR